VSGLRLARQGLARHLIALGAGLAALAISTAAIYALRPVAPDVALGVVYVPALLAVAVLFGMPHALAASVASMLAFNFLFLPPVHSFTLRDSENWVALGVYLAVAVVVGELAARTRRRTDEAVQRRREAELLADVSATLLEPGAVQAKLRRVEENLRAVLDVPRVHLEVGSLRAPTETEEMLPLEAAGRNVGRAFFERGAAPRPNVAARVLPAVASLLAFAADREQLTHRAVEAETLRRSDLVKTAVLRSVSHDLRSPLTAIRAAGEGLERGVDDLPDEDRLELLATIRDAARRLDRLVANLLDLSRLEADAAKPRPELWPLDELVGRALEQLGSDADRVRVAWDGEPPLVRVDARQVERVLVNLIENALKFSPPGAPVEVRSERGGPEALVRVTDRGPGLSPRDLGRVFEPFERGAVGAGVSGSGLGLAIAKGFAQANQGRVWAESEPGSGASFVLALPAVELPVATP
jgi:two-component system, OmpR family, sensor histidine kinase KdpD